MIEHTLSQTSKYVTEIISYIYKGFLKLCCNSDKTQNSLKKLFVVNDEKNLNIYWE